MPESLLSPALLRELRQQEDDDQQALSIGTLARGLAMLGEHIAGEPDQLIAVMRDVGDDGALRIFSGQKLQREPLDVALRRLNRREHLFDGVHGGKRRHARAPQRR